MLGRRPGGRTPGIRKGAFEAIRRIVVEQAGHPFATEVERTVKKISENGGTPLVVCENE